MKLTVHRSSIAEGLLVVAATVLILLAFMVWGAEGSPTAAMITPGTGTVFADVPADHAYAGAIEGLQYNGIVSGYEIAPGVFAFFPENPVWRAQFAKMIVGARHLHVDESLTSPFADMGPDDPGDPYPHEYVAAAALAGITTGTTPTSFAPWGDITRAQLVTMVMRSLYNDPSVDLPPVPAGFTGTLGMFDPVHGETMRHAEHLGLLSALEGFGPGWDPWATATRGEVAQLLYTLILS